MLRKALWARGLRYRINVRLPGKPDLVFPGSQVAVFVDGDFWHGRSWEQRKAKLAEGSNPTYWTAKIGYNIEHDRDVTATLRQNGWTVLRFWETDIRTDPRPAVACVLEALEKP